MCLQLFTKLTGNRYYFIYYCISLRHRHPKHRREPLFIITLGNVLLINPVTNIVNIIWSAEPRAGKFSIENVFNLEVT